MEKVKKYFGNFNMSWTRVIILSVVTAVYTALINQVGFLKDTSFRDIAIAFECWILFAVFIIVNCEKIWEAVLKCFVFFLISQPLIYLIEVPFLGFEVFRYYKYWFIMTLLTIPGAAIAFLLKKKNILSVVVLCVANAYLAYMSVHYFNVSLFAFPHHLLSSLFCIALSFFFIFVLLDKKNHKAVATAFAVAVVIISVVITSRGHKSNFYLDDGVWNAKMQGDSIVQIHIEDGNHVKVTAKKDGNSHIIFKNQNGEEIEYYITVSGGNVFAQRFEG